MSCIAEEPVVIQGDLPLPMLGMLTLPDASQPPAQSGVVIVNGGAQYRAGAHRMFVLLARELAGMGHAVVRFDFPGQGDSPGESIGFEQTSQHIRSSIDTLLRRVPSIQKTALLGLCDGASASLLYVDACQDPRINCLVLINPWVHNELLEAKAQVRHYYRQRFLMPDFWAKLLQGKVMWSALAEFFRKLLIASHTPSVASSESFPARMACAWKTFPGPISVVLSDYDQVAQEFQTFLEGHHAGDRIRAVSTLPTDHTLSTQASDVHCISVQTDACLKASTSQ